VASSLKKACHFRDRHLSIAVLPNDGGGFIETVRFVTVEIIDQHLVRQFSNNQLVCSRARGKTWLAFALI
jgi:hypothetical protein